MVRWRCTVMSRRMSATRRVSHTAGGSTTSEINDSRQFRTTIAAAVATAVVKLDATDVATVVMTPCMPAMSWRRRDCTSPPRVRLKKLIDCSWRWSNTRTRRSCMTRLPIRVDSQV